MKTESRYAFRQDLCTVHRRIYGSKQIPESDELVLTDGITISTKGLSPVALLAAKDFRNYLKTAFGIKAQLVENGGTVTAVINQTDLGDADGYMGRKITVSETGIRIQAYDERGVAQAFYSLEDRMNFRQAPFLKIGTTEEKPLFSPRMVHSAYDVDVFPNEYLSVCAHYGYDAILVFVKDSTHSACGECDFHELIRRAAKYGIDVYAYSYVDHYINPLDEGAKESYTEVFGSIFRDVPEFKGMVFVSESAEFPSRDPRVSNEQSVDGIPTGKLSQRNFPCSDYIDWVKLVRDSIRAEAPDAEIIFWTYNFGRAPLDARIEFIQKLPQDITLLVTFNMFQPVELENCTAIVQDYSLSYPHPSDRFLVDAAEAKKRNIRLYSMVNTGGRTWDFGVAPYEPFPWQWDTLHREILQAGKEFGLCGLMESHHFGFTPSFIAMQAKQTFTQGGLALEDYLQNWAMRVGQEHWECLLEGMKLVDQSIHWYVASNENQYGPYRIGPAFPFCLRKVYKKPDKKELLYGNRIYHAHIFHEDLVGPDYHPYHLRRQDEIRRHKKAAELTWGGLRILKRIPNKTEELKKLINLIAFLYRCHITAVNFKEFSCMKEKMFASASWKETERLAGRIRVLLHREVNNVRATIPLVLADSSLGYEPSMDYTCDEEALNWKLRQLQYVLEHELPAYERNKK